jgi:uncharacterized protein Yka (UPF0111/DUF47 family)
LDHSIPVTKKVSRSWLQTALRAIVPKDDRFFDLLEEQARIGQVAARKLVQLNSDDVASVADDVQALEHQGDKAVHRLEEALASTFVTPLDREDIQKLSAELDDVLDYANAAVRSCVLRGVNRPTQPMIEMIMLLAVSADLLHEAVCCLRRHDYDKVTDLARKVRKLESDGDMHYRKAIFDLNHDDGVDAKRLRREEKVLDDLENALNHAEDLADTLINLAVKHG